MRALLDTHAVIWAIGAPGRLGERARVVVEDPSSELLVSAATAWEVFTKRRTGKADGIENLSAGWDEHLSALGVIELPITMKHGRIAGMLEWGHRDPFDRMLAAQALVEGVPLITRDPAFATSGARTIW